MSIAEAEETARGNELVDQLRTWLEENWDPDLTVAEWWGRLGLAGWSAPMLPTDSYGRGLTRRDSMRVGQIIAEFGGLGAPGGLGLGLAAPTIATHGTRQQIDTYVRDIVTGQKAWCQLFSEPGAGSDLAGLTSRAVRDGDVWIINGQKVWTSGGQHADLGMLLARTNPDAPKHQGITWFAFDMHQPGVEIRPLRQMTGAAGFNEVFFTDATVDDSARIGDLNNGWAVAQTTLHHERSGMGAGGGGRGGGAEAAAMRRMAIPGTVAGHLTRRVGEFVGGRTRPSRPRPAEPARPAVGRRTSPAQDYIDLARKLGKDTDPVIRQGLARLHTLRELARMNTERHRAVVAKGGDIPGIPNFSKLLMADNVRLTRDLGMQIVGMSGTLYAYDEEGRAQVASQVGPEVMSVAGQALGAQALPIFGGTDQIQRNIIGERILGLPKDPGDLANLPFSQIPKNA
ncbi:MAG TPA: acyl-CoA dehydrogenase family protein [Acidimicrobiales bacterium]|nr:acyl-CoA dehydrogenase family protein [Acidimicrobiales bacterium]